MKQGITGVVLAGGLGRRMGRVDKGLQLLQGRPLVEWAIERFAPQVDELLINANENVETYGRFGWRVVPDAIAGYAGPLAGLHRALQEATTPLVATVPCDSPFLPVDLVARLGAALQENAAQAAVATAGGRTQSVFCLCRRELLPHLEAFLSGGGRRIDAWYATLRTVHVPFDDGLAFANINTLGDLSQCERGEPPIVEAD
jgi:molybdenum cofactor guanylyltransferase